MGFVDIFMVDYLLKASAKFKHPPHLPHHAPHPLTVQTHGQPITLQQTTT